MSKYYTGVGSRKTPQNILQLMTLIATKMASLNYILRSGGAQGADKAFEEGAGVMKEIYYANDATTEAIELASKFHPAWGKCSMYAKKLHGRNSFQVLGLNLKTPSEYCICWTPDGCLSHSTRQYQTGGTGTAISISEYYKVQIVNLALSDHYNHWYQWAIK